MKMSEKYAASKQFYQIVPLDKLPAYRCANKNTKSDRRSMVKVQENVV